jgi:hypothetical protein
MAEIGMFIVCLPLRILKAFFSDHSGVYSRLETNRGVDERIGREMLGEIDRQTDRHDLHSKLSFYFVKSA